MRTYGIDLSLPELPRETLAAHYKDILSDMGETATWKGLLRFARDELKHSGSLENALRARYEEDLQYQSVSGRMDRLSTIYGWLGIATLYASVIGFSQGDYADILIVATKEWQDLVGTPDDRLSDVLQASRQLYRDWVFGSVYGYQVVDPDGTEIESCYGYYGFDHEASGLLDAARSVIDVEAAERVALALAQAPFRERAMEAYASDDVQIYPNSVVDIVDDGAWVSASVWVPNEAE